ncbi:bifunctional UDP-N-acetylmuramoyl-tripeptide:D-alanyl-D-alanine ligase/alanine racemase [Rufibacter glacialis]|uniref:Alanine racemase n=1 Tax=Rufibacter glacialis TaxID=1259555 RepID=A0A5M8QBH1_9BACT|nr:bifunctional UDP-N-acetylmuramoyl-tripeptide:D-alanyl-D-alanine ligase/alanine racemase [Rufibacter glacialis]KAA6433347.1 bifunctional UDP-N-acetylmuramoyl-tripeptide:D-alanyl-D-alanine ligase/alanine racemase [Rufibacter glacialis]GGK75119.1 bifunctional UDP-N-acetylmuramoyl-tripeptide:D-alanyl-D-alanine ligase/alanine racemase [Rufibacter glacialis]
MFSFKEIAQVMGGMLVQCNGEYPVQHLLTDSRKIANAVSSVFFAIRGEFHDGHQYLPELYAAGVRQFVVEDAAGILDLSAYPAANVLLVPDSIQALQRLAAYHRRQFTIPVVGITGSNAKTIVKEWLSQLLSASERVVKSPRSYNSQIGVPLSVWQINESHTIGVFEAGISKPAEMEHLASVLQPTIGVFTNLGSAHDEGFSSSSQKMQEKLKLFEHADQLIYCADQPAVQAAIQAAGFPGFAWSAHEHPAAQVQIKVLEMHHGKTKIRFRYAGQGQDFNLPFADDASLENALHCLAVLLYLGLKPQELTHRFERLHPVAMRLERKEAINGCYVIDDTYNNDLAGLRIALDVLGQQARRGRKTLIVSDLLEAGVEELALYRQVAQEITARGVDRVIGIGDIITRHQDLFPAGSEFYLGTDSFLGQLRPETFRQETILVKGARVFQFEKIVAALQQQVHGTLLEVNLDALVHNLNYYRTKIPAQTKIMVMVKAFAYGAGAYEIANLLQFHRVDYLAVAYADEGIALREHGITLPIMVMNPSPDSFLKMQQYSLEPEIYSADLLHQFLDYFPKKSRKTPKIHLKLDTGMHRLGFDAAELEEALTVLDQMPHVRVQSVFSHLAGADEALFNDFTQEQITLFRQMAAQVEKELGYPVTKHILNSAGIVRFGQEAAFDMVRLGIGLYGVESAGQEQSSLQTVGQLKTTVSQVKSIKAGETVGYSRRGVASSDKQTATIAIGYADGYDRRFGNGVGEVLINGQRAPLIGSVCMDMCMVDVTGLDVRAGDEVLVFGEGLPLTELAARIGTIPYELLTNVGTRVKRVFFNA